MPMFVMPRQGITHKKNLLNRDGMRDIFSKAPFKIYFFIGMGANNDHERFLSFTYARAVLSLEFLMRVQIRRFF